VLRLGTALGVTTLPARRLARVSKNTFDTGLACVSKNTFDSGLACVSKKSFD